MGSAIANPDDMMMMNDDICMGRMPSAILHWLGSLQLI